MSIPLWAYILFGLVVGMSFGMYIEYWATYDKWKDYLNNGATQKNTYGTTESTTIHSGTNVESR